MSPKKTFILVIPFFIEKHGENDFLFNADKKEITTRQIKIIKNIGNIFFINISKQF